MQEKTHCKSPGSCMSLDPLSIFIAALVSTSLVGGLLLLSWFLNRQIRSLLWWSMSFGLASLGFLGLLAGADSAHNLIRELANASILAGYGLALAACRLFNRRTTHWAVILVAPALWLIACWGLNVDISTRMVLVALGCGIYTFSMAAELWFGMRERLLSQRAAAALCAFHGCYFGLRVISGPTLLRSVAWVEQLNSAWVLILSFETLIFTISFGFLVLSMSKEKIEVRHRKAALQDPLTGIANRRAFKEQADRRLTSNQQSGRASSFMLMDLDHFKSINDRYGHDGGDQVLVGFTELVTNLIEPDDLFCRMGGEEFAVFLSDANTDRALDIAESIRTILDTRGLKVYGKDIPVTVSIGVVSSGAPDVSLRSLLAHADSALYSAKAGGRNCVVVYDEATAPQEPEALAGAPAAASALLASSNATFSAALLAFWCLPLALLPAMAI